MVENKRKARVESKSPRILLPSTDQLVDRKKQITRFADVLDRISRQGPVSSNLFEWYGSPGIGKSMLIKLLSAKADEMHVAWTIVNFKQSAKKNDSYLKNPIRLIEEITSSLNLQVKLDLREFDSALAAFQKLPLPEGGIVAAYAAMDQETRLYRRPDWLTELRNVIVAFIKLINTLPSQSKADGIRPVVLFFDETEYANIELVDWIEEWVINPLIQIKHCVVVWTARRPWRWKRPEIRRRLTSEMLEVFEEEEVQDQIQSGSANPDLVSELFKNVHTLTGGHPFASFIVINELDTLLKQGERVTPDNFQDFESKLLEEIFDRFVNQYVFSGLESNDLKIACKYISLVRLFDTIMLRRILQVCAGDVFVKWDQDDFGDLLLKLKKTQLLVWEKGYAIDPGLRHIVQKYFMVLDRNKFISANREALQVYKEWLERPVDNRSLFILEELYHSAALMQVGEMADLQAILEKRLSEYPEWIRDEQALENALERLEGEIGNDKELEQYLSTVELVKIVQKFRRQNH
jgi:Cdc6-like AAA superfamily ATPase